MECMAEHELDAGDERAAQLLLDQLEDPSSTLVERARVLAEERREAERLLAEVAADRSPHTEWIARFGVMSVIGGIWMATPVGTWLLGVPHGFARELAISGATFLLSVAAMALLWRALLRSRLNRVFITMVAMGPALAFLLNLGLLLGGYDSSISNTLELFLYASCVLVVAVFADGWLLPGALAFFVAFFLAMAFEGTSLLWMNLANVVVVLNASTVWGLRALRGGDGPMDRPLIRR